MLDLEGKKYYNEQEVAEKIKEAKLELIEKYRKGVNEIHDIITPDEDYMFHGKKNTSVKFKNGESITVRRMKGETDSVETAFAYIIAYACLGKKKFRQLVKKFKEVV